MTESRVDSGPAHISFGEAVKASRPQPSNGMNATGTASPGFFGRLGGGVKRVVVTLISAVGELLGVFWTRL